MWRTNLRTLETCCGAPCAFKSIRRRTCSKALAGEAGFRLVEDLSADTRPAANQRGAMLPINAAKDAREAWICSRGPTSLKK